MCASGCDDGAATVTDGRRVTSFIDWAMMARAEGLTKDFCYCDRHPAGIDIATEAFRRVFPRAWTGGRADAASVSAAVSQ